MYCVYTQMQQRDHRYADCGLSSRPKHGSAWFLQENWRRVFARQQPAGTATVCIKVHADMFSHSLLLPGTDLLQLQAAREAARQEYEEGSKLHSGGAVSGPAPHSDGLCILLHSFHDTIGLYLQACAIHCIVPVGQCSHFLESASTEAMYATPGTAGHMCHKGLLVRDCISTFTSCIHLQCQVGSTGFVWALMS